MKNKNQTKAAYCPSCISWMVDCFITSEEWLLPCDRFEEAKHDRNGLDKERIPSDLRQEGDPQRQAKRLDWSDLSGEWQCHAEKDRIQEELEHAHSIYGENSSWPVIDVTSKSLEEISQEVLGALLGEDRKL